MAFLLPKMPPSPLLPHPSRSHNVHGTKLFSHSLSPSLLTKLEPPLTSQAKLATPPTTSSTPNVDKSKNENKGDFYLNLGVAVRTLRDDLPSLFSRDLNYDIYREDITFVDPLNTFQGIDNYKLIFWALRFHGRILFREIGFEIFRVWQPSENSILIRWELRGVPRVPWEASGRFQGTSRYKLDRNGKIYEHKVDNLAFNFPRAVQPTTVLDLVAAACPASPNLTFRWDVVDDFGASSWLELYREVRGTLYQQGLEGSDGSVALEGLLVTCL